MLGFIPFLVSPLLELLATNGGKLSFYLAPACSLVPVSGATGRTELRDEPARDGCKKFPFLHSYSFASFFTCRQSHTIVLRSVTMLCYGTLQEASNDELVVTHRLGTTT